MGNTRAAMPALTFLFYLGMGVYAPYASLYWYRLGLSGSQIGTMGAVGMVIAMLAAPAWGMLSDRVGRRVVLAALLLVTAALFVALSQAVAFPLILLISSLLAFTQRPQGSLIDALVLDQTGGKGGAYSRVRLWGSLSYALAVWATGLVLGENLRFIFFGWAIALLLCTLTLPFAGGGPTLPAAAGAPPPSRAGWTAVWGLITRPGFVAVMALLFLAQIAESANSTFFSIYLSQLKASSAQIGAITALGALAEIPMMWWMGRLLERFGAKRLLALSLLVSAVRYLLYALVTTPMAVYFIQPVRGVTFAITWTAAVSLVANLTPPELRSTGQSLLQAFAMTLAGLVGNLAGGAVMDLWGATTLYMAAALIALLAGLGFGIKPRPYTASDHS